MSTRTGSGDLVEHPAAPCHTCRWFVRGWCVLAVLDRYPAPLYDAATCQSHEPRGDRRAA